VRSADAVINDVGMGAMPALEGASRRAGRTDPPRHEATRSTSRRDAADITVATDSLGEQLQRAFTRAARKTLNTVTAALMGSQAR
jgi:hypothetical protein